MLDGVHIPETLELNSWVDGLDRGPVMAFYNGLLYMEPVGEHGLPNLGRHTSGYFSLTKLPYDYDPNAECPKWCDFLYDVMDGDAERVALLKEWADYLLSSSTAQKKFLLIAGDGQNGKTVFTTILEKMVGEDNICYVQLLQFCNQFALAPTLSKEVKRTLSGVKKRQMRFGARRIWLYCSIAVKEDSEVASEQQRING